MERNTSLLHSGRVLLADDDEQFRSGLAARLRHAGYECHCAATAAAALALLEAEEFDVLVSDIHMPGNVNLELISAAPQISAGLPVILVTGRPTVETAARSVRLPVFAYLVKPPATEELLTLLQQAIAGYQRRRAVQGSRQRLQHVTDALAEIEERLARPAQAGDTMTDFLRLTLGNLASSVLDLERATTLAGPNAGAESGQQTAELLAALRHTVTVLEKTRQNFKSKELGQLRHRLQALLDPPPWPDKAAPAPPLPPAASRT